MNPRFFLRIKSSIIISLFFIFCANQVVAEAVPAWVTNFRAVFVADTYIAALGEGKQKDEAKAEATAGLARQFMTIVTDNKTVAGQAELSLVEYTEPYYFKKEKKWACVAFIERDKAWKQCKPVVENAKTKFLAMKKKADSETDPLTKCLLYEKALKSGGAFLEKLEYARFVHPSKEAAYSSDRKAVGELPALIAGERENCSVFLNVTGDYGNIMSVSLATALSKGGFKITKTKKEATYVASALIEDNAIGDDPISITPSLDLKVESKAGKTALAVQANVEKKTVAYTLENARKKAYPLLAEQSEKLILNKLEDR